jgi:hypothetical protein
MPEVSEECKLALKAAMELLGEKCQIPAKATVEVGAASVVVTEEVVAILKKNPMSRAEKIEAVSESEWARHWGESMCLLTSPDLSGSNLEKCRDRLARILAERVTG